MADPYISEVRYLGNKSVDFVEIALDPGFDPSLTQVIIYNSDGTVRSTNNLGTSTGTTGGRDIYVVDENNGTFTGLHKLGGVAVVQDGTVISFSSFDDGSPITATEGPASGLTSVQIGQAGSGNSLESTDGGASFAVQTNPNSGTIPCFTKGTLIETPFGPRKIETLAIGDMVLTRDHGSQTLRWIGQKTLSGADAKSRDLQPIRIQANSFGEGIPKDDLLVSPNHRLLVADGLCNLLFDTPEILTAAKFLVNGTTILRAPPLPSLTYVHLLFDRHEVVKSNGMFSESFHPGQVGLDAFDTDVRDEIFALFPGLRSNTYGPLARHDLRRYEGAVLRDALARPSQFFETVLARAG